MISRLWQKFRCRMGWHVKRSHRSGVWCYSVCSCCGHVGPSHFIPLMKSTSGEGGDV